ncbi:hypothetical protein BKI52_14220 [marine bacterium AO1-C]|nr:hypothetical protein BKI52_14220 [marine bacterium AO1-C]
MAKRQLFVFLFIIISALGVLTQCNQESANPPNNIAPIFRQAMAKKQLTNDAFDFVSMRSADSLINHYLDTFQLKGASMAIVKDGKLIYAKGYGYADLEDSVKVHPGHKFRIASVSKLITAVAIMKLIDEKKLNLTDTVFGKAGILNDSLYLKARDKRMYDITVKQLLNHTGGWCRKCNGDPMFRPLEVAKKLGVKSPISLDDVTKYVFARKLWHKPGTEFGYSNYGYAILGEIVEKVSGKPYETYVQELLKPLGINGIQLAKSFVEQRAPLEVKYYDAKTVAKVRSAYDPSKKVPRTYGGNNLDALAGAGAWIASPLDLLRLTNAIDGRKTVPDILSEKAVLQMITPEGDDIRKVLGWRGCRSHECWRSGSFGGTDAIVVASKSGISWAFVVNSSVESGAAVGKIYRLMNRILRSHQKNLPDINYWGLQPFTK